MAQLLEMWLLIGWRWGGSLVGDGAANWLEMASDGVAYWLEMW